MRSFAFNTKLKLFSTTLMLLCCWLFLEKSEACCCDCCCNCCLDCCFGGGFGGWGCGCGCCGLGGGCGCGYGLGCYGWGRRRRRSAPYVFPLHRLQSFQKREASWAGGDGDHCSEHIWMKLVEEKKRVLKFKHIKETKNGTNWDIIGMLPNGKPMHAQNQTHKQNSDVAKGSKNASARRKRGTDEIRNKLNSTRNPLELVSFKELERIKKCCELCIISNKCLLRHRRQTNGTTPSEGRERSNAFMRGVMTNITFPVTSRDFPTPFPSVPSFLTPSTTSAPVAGITTTKSSMDANLTPSSRQETTPTQDHLEMQELIGSNGTLYKNNTDEQRKMYHY